MTEPPIEPRRPAAAVAVGWLAVVGAVGAAWMMLAHLGLDVAVLDAFGPGRMLAPVAAGFAVGTVLFAIVAHGAFRAARWVWPVGLVVNGLAFVSAAVPFRGWVSAIAMLVALAAVVVLLSPQGRSAFRD